MSTATQNPPSEAPPALPHGTALKQVTFDVPSIYQLTHVVGEGGYGVVCSAFKSDTGEQVAIKKVPAFINPIFCLRTLREIKILQHFQHENIIGIVDIPRPKYSLTDIYIVQELMDTDLGKVIKSQTLTEDHMQYFMYQILRGVKAIHSAEILHRDLKPGNLLVNSNCDLKICDFGLSRSALPHHSGEDPDSAYLTEYVATRWYRAPEVMLTQQHYTKAIDMWSIGCIFAEMLGRYPLFPGKDFCDQLDLILKVTGTPSPEDFMEIKSKRSRHYIQSLPHADGIKFEQLYPNASPIAIDLLSKLLAFNPKKRITVEQALTHPFIAVYHDSSDEPTFPPLSPEFFDFEKSMMFYAEDKLQDLVKQQLYDGQ